MVIHSRQGVAVRVLRFVQKNASALAVDSLETFSSLSRPRRESSETPPPDQSLIGGDAQAVRAMSFVVQSLWLLR